MRAWEFLPKDWSGKRVLRHIIPAMRVLPILLAVHIMKRDLYQYVQHHGQDLQVLSSQTMELWHHWIKKASSRGPCKLYCNEDVLALSRK